MISLCFSFFLSFGSSTLKLNLRLFLLFVNIIFKWCSRIKKLEEKQRMMIPHFCLSFFRRNCSNNLKKVWSNIDSTIVELNKFAKWFHILLIVLKWKKCYVKMCMNQWRLPNLQICSKMMSQLIWYFLKPCFPCFTFIFILVR